MVGVSAPKIHVSLPADVHRKLRVRVALDNTTIQDFVENLVQDAVKSVKLPKEA